MSYDKDNIFAKILRGEIPACRVYEDELTLAFMDIMPQTKGHTLIIPKSEASNIFEITDDMLAATVATTRKVALAVQDTFEPAGMMIGQLNGPVAGQTVFHLHFHVIPRYEAGGFRFHECPPEDVAVLEEHAAAIRAQLESKV